MISGSRGSSREGELELFKFKYVSDEANRSVMINPSLFIK